MDIDALLEAIQDYEKKGKKETCPVLEQFLCHVAKTGQPMIPWSQFKAYFMFKLEKVMDDFHASTPEQRGPHNPNVEYVPFEDMKKRIMKIVDGYNGIPFTIQRLCELLTDPKRNYTGTDKFLMGLEKNVMVVSCVHPTSEKNGASSVNRMNGVMFPGNSSLYSDRNINGPGTPKPHNRPKLSLSTSLSTNGLPECPVGKEPEPSAEEVEEQHVSDSSLSEGDISPNTGIKNKHSDEEEEENSDTDKHEVKRLKFDEKEEDEAEGGEKDSSCCKGSDSSPETTESSKDSSGQENESGASGGAPTISKDHESSSTDTEPPEGDDDPSDKGDAHSLEKDGGSPDQPKQPSSSEKSEKFDGDGSSSSDGEGASSAKQVPSSDDSPDSSTEGSAEDSNSTKTATEPGEHD
ncbi:serine/threonine-protein phosphatase 4 regulatory subunit 2-like isoform X1 [Xyrichtys novacula]|uniref:Serine/threonine-protein phosphatase 4 regulatory subunit 2-like isoform X1 n=1 Tax=Xyrichtys novacula TaxID=13765 RepID=A0AAV1HFA1_XYRNO|nr:serine/threonine-protein phosphatase 4 regulatory subunit 2-like isoform X1 [Xyrichtys novacula]